MRLFDAGVRMVENHSEVPDPESGEKQKKKTKERRSGGACARQGLGGWLRAGT